MIEGITILLILRVATSIILLWGTSLAIRRSGLFWPFFPLIIYFIGISGTASAEFYEVFNNQLQAVFDSIFLIFYIWTLVVILLLIKKRL